MPETKWKTNWRALLVAALFSGAAVVLAGCGLFGVGMMLCAFAHGEGCETPFVVLMAAILIAWLFFLRDVHRKSRTRMLPPQG